MSTTLTRAAIVAVPVVALLVVSCVAFLRDRTAAALLSALSAVSFGVVVLTHVAESAGWLPWMRWGQPSSLGHYVDLTSAVGGVLLILSAIIVHTATRWR